MVEHVRIGIVDMGSNAVRFLIAETNGREHRTVESHRLAVRLGKNVFQSGLIDESAMAATVNAFRKFRKSCERNGVTRTRVIATAAMRAAKNGKELIERVRAASQFQVDVISGEQEAQLLKAGIETRIDLSQGRSLLVDVGGGSVEIVVVDNRAGDNTDASTVQSADSHELGALRMLELFRHADRSQFVELVKAHLQQHLRPLFHAPIDRYVAVGGSIESLADLIRGEAGSESCSIADLERQITSLAMLTTDERIEQLGLRPDRADAIVPAGLVYLHLAQLANVTSVHIPRTGVKEGLIAATSGLSDKPSATDTEVTFAACRQLGARHQYEAGHAESVRSLAEQLFEQTRELHQLDDRALLLLQAAALLHDIGRSISSDSHHKHSQYLIEANAITGLDRPARHLVAMIARYHRKALPTGEHKPFDTLPSSEQTTVKQLAALLRLADALDRQHAQVVDGVEATVREQRLELRVSPADNSSQLALEAAAIASKGELFEQVFGYKPSLVTP